MPGHTARRTEAKVFSWVVILPLLKKFGPWIAAVVGVVAVVGVPYIMGRSHGAEKWEGKFNTAVAERRDATDERDAAVRERDQARAAVDACNTATDLYRSEADARIARLNAALAAEPKTITEYRDRIKVVDRIIQSEDCVTAITEVAEVLKGVDPP